MINEHRELKLLPVNKSVLFQTPLETDNVCVVRTGVYSDQNNSFIHAFLSGYSKEYYNLETSEKDKFILKFKKTIFDKKSWNNDKKYFKYFSKNVNDTFLLIYKFIEKVIKEDQDVKGELSRISDKITLNIIKNIILKNINLFDLMTELLPIELLKDILDIEGSNFSIKIYKENVLFNLNKNLDDIEIFDEIEEKRVKFIKDNINKLFIFILDEIDEDLFKFYVNRSKMLPENNILNILTNKLNRNIYFIDSDTRLPIMVDNKQLYDKENKNIILLKINNNYEILGQLLKGNKIKREFESEDYLVLQINKLLFGYEKDNDNENKDNKELEETEKKENNKTKETYENEPNKLDENETKENEKLDENETKETEKLDENETKETEKLDENDETKETEKLDENETKENDKLEDIFNLEDDDFEIPKRKYSISDNESTSSEYNKDDNDEIKKNWFNDSDEDSETDDEDTDSEDTDSDKSSTAS